MKDMSNNESLLDNRIYFKYVDYKLENCSVVKLSSFYYGYLYLNIHLGSMQKEEFSYIDSTEKI